MLQHLLANGNVDHHCARAWLTLAQSMYHLMFGRNTVDIDVVLSMLPISLGWQKQAIVMWWIFWYLMSASKWPLKNCYFWKVRYSSALWFPLMSPHGWIEGWEWEILIRACLYQSLTLPLKCTAFDMSLKHHKVKVTQGLVISMIICVTILDNNDIASALWDGWTQ